MRTQLNPGWFITLTYDEGHVKRIGDRMSLRFRDIQLYIKRLRKAKHYVKYVAVGEYGTETLRPHYHLLIWTTASPRILEEQWKSSKDNTILGSLHFGKLNMQSAMYTLKYIIQPKQKYDNGLERTRAQFSRGLGLAYLNTTMYDYHTSDYENPILFGIIDGAKVALPRYYKNKIFTKYQMRVQCHETKLKSEEAYNDAIAKLHRAGVVDAARIYRETRIESSKRIIKKTKTGLKL